MPSEPQVKLASSAGYALSALDIKMPARISRIAGAESWRTLARSGTKRSADALHQLGRLRQIRQCLADLAPALDAFLVKQQAGIERDVLAATAMRVQQT